LAKVAVQCHANTVVVNQSLALRINPATFAKPETVTGKLSTTNNPKIDVQKGGRKSECFAKLEKVPANLKAKSFARKWVNGTWRTIVSKFYRPIQVQKQVGLNERPKPNKKTLTPPFFSPKKGGFP